MIKQRLGIEPTVTPGSTGQFDVIADGETVATRDGNWLTRSFGAGYPDLNAVVENLQKRNG
jgi:hypothetical protein